MQIYRNRLRFGISAAACVLLALAVLVLPIRWILAAIAAAVWHELFHVATVYLCGGSISGLTIDGNGAVMDAHPMSKGRELICSLAGPLGGFLLLLFVRWIPRTAICAVFHSLYNILPIYPLDGGRALRCGAELILPLKANQICAGIEKGCLFLIVLLAVYAAVFLKLGLFPLLLTAALYLKVRNTRK